jgi:hypothetical protein
VSGPGRRGEITAAALGLAAGRAWPCLTGPALSMGAVLVSCAQCGAAEVHGPAPPCTSGSPCSCLTVTDMGASAWRADFTSEHVSSMLAEVGIGGLPAACPQGGRCPTCALMVRLCCAPLNCIVVRCPRLPAERDARSATRRCHAAPSPGRHRAGAADDGGRRRARTRGRQQRRVQIWRVRINWVPRGVQVSSGCHGAEDGEPGKHHLRRLGLLVTYPLLELAPLPHAHRPGRRAAGAALDRGGARHLRRPHALQVTNTRDCGAALSRGAPAP